MLTGGTVYGGVLPLGLELDAAGVGFGVVAVCGAFGRKLVRGVWFVICKPGSRMRLDDVFMI